MALPGYVAEGSLYKTSQSYRGAYGGQAGYAGATVIAQLDCQDSCALKWQACNIGCAAGSGPLVGLCLAGCGVAFAVCLDDCPSGGGGGGGGGGHRVCCEWDQRGRCTIWRPLGGVCP
jgi:hypothetical protein